MNRRRYRAILGDDEVVPELKALFAESIAASPAGWTAMQVPLPLGLLFSVECVVTIGE